MSLELGLSPEAHALLLNKPAEWRFLLFAQMLEEALGPFLSQRQEESASHSAPEVVASEDFDFWLGARNSEWQQNFSALVAFVPRTQDWARTPDTPLDASSPRVLSIQDGSLVGEVRSLVSVFVSTYLAGVQHQTRLRQVQVEDLYRPFLEEAAQLPDAFLDALEFCPHDLREQVNALSTAPPAHSDEEVETDDQTEAEIENTGENESEEAPDRKAAPEDAQQLPSVEIRIFPDAHNAESFELERIALLRRLGHLPPEDQVVNAVGSQVEAPDLLGFLEKYLLREGLHDVIPERRDSDVFKPSLGSFYFPSLLLIPLVILWERYGWDVAHLVFPFVLIGSGGILSITPLVIIHQVTNRGNSINANSAFYALGVALPLWMAVGMGIKMRSWLIFWVCLVSYFLLIIAVGLLNIKARWLSQWWSNARITAHIARKSLTLLPLLVPQLLVLALFPLFSAELWQVLTGMSFQSIGWLALGFTGLFSILVWTQRHVADEIVWTRQFEADSFHRNLRHIPWMKRHFDADLVSLEEFFEVGAELKWREPFWLVRDVLPRLRRRIRQVVFGVTLVNALAVWVLFSLLLFSFFSLALRPEVLDSWIHPGEPTWTAQTLITRAVGVAPLSYSVSIPALLWARLKVSLLLGLFLAAFAVGFTLTDGKVQARYKEWLETDLDWWLSASACYVALAHPNYHICNYLKKKDGIANLDIVVHPELEEDAVREICDTIGEHHTQYKKIVIVRAHPKQEEEYAEYNTKSSHAWWQWIHNKTNGHQGFTQTQESDDDSSLYLGDVCFKAKEEIPDTWFGTCPEVGRAIWNADSKHKLILRPVADRYDNNVFLKIYLKKRLPVSGSYRKLMRECVSYVDQVVPQTNLIQIEVFLREDPEALGNLILNKDQNLIDYSDERQSKSRWTGKRRPTETLDNWLDG